MKKRLLTIGLVLLLVVTMLPIASWAAPKEPTAAEKEQTIAALQALMVGVRFESTRNEKVAYWSDTVILQMICNKLLWEEKLVGDTIYFQKMDLTTETSEEGQIGYPLAVVQQLAFDIYGSGFSKNSQSEGVRISGDKLWLTPAEEEEMAYEQLCVLDYEQTGDRVLAVGMAISHNKGNTKLQDYFAAEFTRNSDCVYGYTLQTLRSLEIDTEITNLTASASSYLRNESQYAAKNVIDGSKKTAWVEDDKGLGINEWIRLDTDDGSEMSIQTIELHLGYQKSDSTLKKNGWPTKLRLQAADGWEMTVPFQNYNDVIVLTEPLTTPWIRFTVVEAETGSTYEDIAISEIRLGGVDSQAAFDRYWEAVSEESDTRGRLETLYDGDVYISRSPGFEQGTKLSAPMLSGEQKKEALTSFAEGELKTYTVYDLSIQLQDGTDYQEEKRILEINLPVPDQNLEEGWMVYRIQDDMHTRIQFEYANGYVTIHTRDLGRYIVTTLNKGETVADTEEGEQVILQFDKDTMITVLIIAIIVVLLVGAWSIIRLLLRKRDNWDDNE